MQDAACTIVSYVWILRAGGQLWGVEKPGEAHFFILIFSVEDNEGKRFHFKGIVYRKSERDLNGEGSL